MIAPTGQFPLYNFYQRYLWNPVDFANWQNGMIQQGQAPFNGLFNGAVMSGFAISSSGGLTLQVASGIAVGASGYMHVPAAGNFSFSAPGAGLAQRILLVATPNVQNGTLITRPTAPFDTVPLWQSLGSTISALIGTAASSPQYPTKGLNDVIIGGFRIGNGQTTIANENLDFEVKEIYGKNSDFQENLAKYDDRLRCYRSALLIGIKPSQLVYPRPYAFTYINQNTPSLFPRQSGAFVNQDTFLNMQTGAITGGDTTSSAFTPQIPTAGNAIVATISITSNDTLVVNYGAVGTRAQCFTALQNQTYGASAGNLGTPGGVKIIAFVMVFSIDGANVTEVDHIDGRGISGAGLASGGIRTVTTTTTFTIADQMVRANASGGSVSGLLPSLASTPVNTKFIYKNVGASGSTAILVPNGADKIDGLSSVSLAATPTQEAIAVINSTSQWDII